MQVGDGGESNTQSAPYEITLCSLCTDDPCVKPSFWINLPIGVFTIAVIVLLFENPENQTVSKGSIVSKLQQLNIPNLLLFTASVVCLLLALEWGGTSYHWTSGRIIALLVVSTGLLVAFVGLEAIQKEQATIPASIILNKTAGLCVLYAFCASAAFNVVDYFVSYPKLDTPKIALRKMRFTANFASLF